MKYNIDNNEVLSIYGDGSISKSEAARRYCIKNGILFDHKIRRKISHIINNHSEKQPIRQVFEGEDVVGKDVFDAVGSDGKIMTIEKYCETYGLDYSKVKSYKLITHTGKSFYNVSFVEGGEVETISTEEFLEKTSSFFKSLEKPLHKTELREGKVGVVKVADLHIGAVISGLINTPDYDTSIVAERLQSAAQYVNRFGYDVVHIHILGDIIEAFDVKMHAGMWKNVDVRVYGVEAVKIATTLLHKYFLSLIHNLGEVKIVGGNHGRVTADKTDDTESGAENLIAWGLSLIGYDVEFNPFVITHHVDGICHILTHGHHGISKKSTQQICWDYGTKGMFNLICEGHLHSNIERLAVNKIDSYQVVKDDSVDHRRMNVPSFFTGNSFSEYLGYTSSAGFLIVEDNGYGKPNIFNFSL